MTVRQTTNILGWIFMIGALFGSYGANIICCSIFFAVNYIVKTIEENNSKK